MEVDLGNLTKWMKIPNKKNRTQESPLADQYDSIHSEDESLKKGPVDVDALDEMVHKEMRSSNINNHAPVPSRNFDSRSKDVQFIGMHEHEEDEVEEEVEEEGFEVSIGSEQYDSIESSSFQKRRKIPNICMGNAVTLVSIAIVGTFLAAAIVLFARNSGFGSANRGNSAKNIGGDPPLSEGSNPANSPSNLVPTTLSPTSMGATWVGIGRLTNDSFKEISHATLSNEGRSFGVMFPNPSKKPSVVQVHEITNQGLLQRGNDIVPPSSNVEDDVLAFAMNDEGSRIAVSYKVDSIGYVRVFQFLFDDWAPLGSPLLGESNDDFGLSMAFSGDGMKLAVAAIKDNRARGIVRIYDFDGNDWQFNENSPTGLAEGDLLGILVDLSKNGSRLLTAQNFGSSVNAQETIQMYTIDQNNSWQKLGNAIQRNAPPAEFYTSSLSLSDNGSIMAVSNGATDSSPTPTTDVYSVGSNLEWTKMGSSLAGDGCFLAGDGNDIVVASFVEKTTTTYRWRSGQWVQKGLTRPGMDQVLNTGGVSLSKDGQRMLIYEDLSFNENVGFRSRIRLFQYGN